MDLNDINQLFNYTEWANHLVLDAAEKLSEEQQKHDFKIGHCSIHGTLTHMAGAEWLWLERWRGTSPSRIWAAEDFMDILAIRARWQQIEDERRSLLDSLGEEELCRDLSYRNLKGEPFALPLIAQMQHLVNHSTQHRGQAVGMIRQLGIQPPAVDLLYYLILLRPQRGAI
jgi:uncharacterized damage-inducible protein DinB